MFAEINGLSTGDTGKNVMLCLQHQQKQTSYTTLINSIHRFSFIRGGQHKQIPQNSISFFSKGNKQKKEPIEVENTNLSKHIN